MRERMQSIRRACRLAFLTVMASGLLTGCGGGRSVVGLNESSPSSEFSDIKLARRGGQKNVSPPKISKATVNPIAFEFLGGTVRIQADVKAKKKDVVTVNAIITRQSDGQTFNVPLNKVKGKTFAGDFTAPPNPTINPHTYNVVIQATDNRPLPGRPAQANAGSFTVRSVPLPPPPPGS